MDDPSTLAGALGPEELLKFASNNNIANKYMLVGPTQRGKTTLLDGWMGGWLGNLKIYPTQKAELATSY